MNRYGRSTDAVRPHAAHPRKLVDQEEPRVPDLLLQHA
jgi:hypothetical protein